MSEQHIPERWQQTYRRAAKWDDGGLEGGELQLLIGELGAAEAKVAELERELIDSRAEQQDEIDLKTLCIRGQAATIERMREELDAISRNRCAYCTNGEMAYAAVNPASQKEQPDAD